MVLFGIDDNHDEVDDPVDVNKAATCGSKTFSEFDNCLWYLNEILLSTYIPKSFTLSFISINPSYPGK